MENCEKKKLTEQSPRDEEDIFIRKSDGGGGLTKCHSKEEDEDEDEDEEEEEEK
jgi:hypothetical protein